MKVGDCPSCRAPVEFRPGSGKVKVCEFCNTVVLRGNAGLENLGRVAELTDTESPLKLNLSGRYSGSPFTVVGRLQKNNPTGTWDEWCLQFEDGRMAWLAESEGAWNLMFPLEGLKPPPLAKLSPLYTFPLRDKKFVVEEVGSATTASAQGQLPDYAAEHRYADCTGPKGVFASLEYSGDSGGEAYVGSTVALSQLGFDKHELQPTPKRDSLTAARCTQCNGPLELKAPDAAKRVACPYCGALLEVAHGTLSFLELLQKPPYEPAVKLGSKATFDKIEWTVLAFLIRSCNVEGTRYPWEEYLLWNHTHGFRWLMNSTGHWTMLTPIAAGDVTLGNRSAQHDKTSYRQYQEVYTQTDYVAGECYWTVTVGETAKAREFVAPPRSINIDETANEVTFTAGVMLTPEEVSKAFKLGPLNPPLGIASAQVNPFREKSGDAWKWFSIWSVALLALLIVFAAIGDTTSFFEGAFSVPAGAASGSADAQRFSEPFKISKKVPLEVTVSAPNLDNSWLGVSADLVNEQTGEVISVYAEDSYYSGVEDGESWSEGSRSSSKQTSEVDPGSYVLRVTPQFDTGRPADFTVSVKADDGVGVCCPFALFFLLMLLPLYYTLRSSSFETQRWNEAVFQTSPGVSTFPYLKVSSSDDD